MEERIVEAQEIYGKVLVGEVIDLVDMIGEKDGVWSMYKDMEMDDHADCLEMIYFES